MERLHKILAHCGVGSRRDCEELISQGRVDVNGQVVTELGTKVDPAADRIRVDGEKVKIEPHVYYLVHKPRGYLCTNEDTHGRPKVIDLIPQQRRVYTVGRLDEGSEGLIILTNDGALANLVTHPRYKVDKTYRLTIAGPVTPEQLDRVSRGVWLSDGKTAPAAIRGVQRNRGRTFVTVTIHEGKNRELRRVFAKVGLRVQALLRVGIGPLRLDDLRKGAYRLLHPRELDFVRKRTDGDAPVEKKKPARRPPLVRKHRRP